MNVTGSIRANNNAYAVGDVLMRVSSSHPVVQRFVAQTNAPMLVHTDQESAVHSAEIEVTNNGARLHFDGRPITWPLEPLERSDPFLAAFYGNREVFIHAMLANTRSWPVYAAAVRTTAGAVLLVGPSCSGKTVLTLQLMLLGADFYSDESLFIDRSSGAISALKRHMMIREPALQYLPAEIIRTIRSLFDCEQCADGKLWYAVDAEKLIRTGINAFPAPLCAVVFLSSHRAERPALKRLPAALGTVILRSRVHRGITDMQTAELRKLLDGVPMYGLTAGLPQETARLLIQALR